MSDAAGSKCATCGTGEPILPGVPFCLACAGKVALGAAQNVRQRAHEALDRGLVGLLGGITQAVAPKDKGEGEVGEKDKDKEGG